MHITNFLIWYELTVNDLYIFQSTDSFYSNSIIQNDFINISTNGLELQFPILYDLMSIFENFVYTNFSNYFHLLNLETENLETENSKTLLHYSIPTTRLFYPEPFIASPSFLHTDLWFMHILIYQYWLWFVFIFIIIFFFIMFLGTLHWSNLRYRPKRETRGVSRSKCGDLITATVPVTWATSIIIHESTDAIDFFDGFGTTELAIGIRAYQWGWEYYYPKDIDLFYKINQSQSLNLGNSLKYNKQTSTNYFTLKFWKLYQKCSNDNIINPLNFLLINTNINSTLNLFNFNMLGNDWLNEPHAFKKLNTISNFKNLYLNKYTINLANTNKFYKNKSHLNEYTSNYTFKLERDSMLLSLGSNFNLALTFLDVKSLNKIITNFSYLNFNQLRSNFTTYKNISNLKIYENKFRNNFNLAITNNFIGKLKFFNHKILDESWEVQEKNIRTYFKQFTFKKELLSQLINKNIEICNETTHSLDNIYQFNLNKNSLLQFFNKNIMLGTGVPIKSTNSYFNSLEFDSDKNSDVEDQALLLAGKDDVIAWPYRLSFLNTWRSDLTVNKRIDVFMQYLNKLNTLTNYIPPVIIDNNIKRWQSLDLYEDNFWESTTSSYTYFDYFLNLFYYDNSLVTNKKFFFQYWLESKKFTNNIKIFKFKDLLNTYSIPTYYENFNLNKLNLNKKIYSYLNDYASLLISLNDDYVSSIKSLKYFNNLPLKLNFLLNSSFNKFYLTSNNVATTFRADYEAILFFKNILTYSIADLNFIPQFKSSNVIKDVVNNEVLTSVVNMNIYYAAIQKVFRTRFEENRSSTRLINFALNTTKLPFISSNTYTIANNIKKTYVPYNKYNYNLNILNLNYNKNFLNYTLENYYFYDLPFLMAFKSDSARYLWIDWYAKWGISDLQAISYSKQGLYGMPFFTHSFDFNPDTSEKLLETENYISRLHLARKLYLPNWMYVPYLYAKNKVWFTSQIFDFINIDAQSSHTQLNKSLYINFFLRNIWLSYNVSKTNLSLNLFSNINIPSKNLWQSYNYINLYYYYTTQLLDTLMKREYLYRELFETHSLIINLPLELIASPINPIFKDFQSFYKNNSFSSFDINYKRDFFYNLTSNFNTFFFLFETLDTYVKNFKSFIFLKKFYFNLTDQYNNLLTNSLMNKYTNKPLKRGVMNMIRVHASGAIAMPIEMRLQILASSRDVIHSWAIPSAGIKIDCIPGYSSHRLAIFFTHGVYWGQCMEICGRYHHWMPIIVYFMKRDLFFLWCLHFIFFTNMQNNLDMNTHMHLANSSIVSYDKYTWLNEL